MPGFTTDRRHVLAGLTASSALSLVPLVAEAQPVPANPLFRHGVASGDPDHGSVVLWTRVTAGDAQHGSWEMARTPDFAERVQHGTFTTGPERDHTVKVLATGLDAGQVYYYRFAVNGTHSPIGRTRTLPDGRVDRLGIALVSCSNYAFGHFNAYDAIARDTAVEFVLHTGDYIYEYGADGWGADTARALGRVHEPAHEIVSLADYRQRHAQYKSDAGSQAMHGAHPLLACWDDHESTNNPWKGGAQNHQPESEGDWEVRRAASIQAYYEWMPVREPEWLAQAGRSRMQFWRAYRFGDLALLHTLETRHTARAEQIDYGEFAEAGDATAAMILAETEAPGRAMLSPELESDLSAAFSASVGAGQPWRLIGNPMPIARTNVPDVLGLGLIADPADAAGDAADAARQLAWKGRYNLPFYPDTWDGYGWARERLYQLSRDAGAGDLVFLTGDSHSFWANQLADGAGRSAGIELGTAGVSSPGDFVESGFDRATAARLDQAFAAHNDEVLWTDNLHQGFVRVELGRDGAVASFIAVDNLLSPDYRTTLVKQFGLTRAAGAVTLMAL